MRSSVPVVTASTRCVPCHALDVAYEHRLALDAGTSGAVSAYEAIGVAVNARALDSDTRYTCK